MFKGQLINICLHKSIAVLLAVSLAFSPSLTLAQTFHLPSAGSRIDLSPVFTPVTLNAVTLLPQNPFKFDFFMDLGQGHLKTQDLDHRNEYMLLIKDFLVALTIPEDRLWVNLSPYEKDKLIDDDFGKTEMGRDLLAQDYLLKQITASLLYPEGDVGKKFWAEIYRRAHEQYGTTDIPIDTFNKVWITPDVAEVYQKGASAMVLRARLKVMLEADYVAAERNPVVSPASIERQTDVRLSLARDVMREVIVPVLEKEVNEGRNFARLRQIYNALILAAWHKKAMRESFLAKTYVDRAKVSGVKQPDETDNLKIYNRYLEAFKKGVVNLVKEDLDIYSGEIIPRKYLSGGFTDKDLAQRVQVLTQLPADYAMADRKVIKVVAGVVPTDKSSKKVVAKDSILESSSASVRKPGEKRKMFTGLEAVKDDVRSKIISMRSTTKKIVALSKSSGVAWGEINLHGKKDIKLEMAKLRRLAKEAFRLYISDLNPEVAKALRESFDYIVDDPNDSDIQKLILTGEYTLEVLKLMSSVGELSQQQAKIPFEKVLDILGLEKAMKDKFTAVTARLKTVEDFINLAKQMEGALVSFPERDDNPLFLDIPSDAREKVQELREKRYALENNDPQLAVILEAERSRHLLPQAFDFLSRMMSSMGMKDSRNKEALLFSRAKSEDSFLGKIMPKDGKDGRPMSRLFDALGGRIAFPAHVGIGPMANAVRSVIKNSTEYDQFVSQLNKQRKAILSALNSSTLSQDRRQAFRAQLFRLENDLKNFTFAERKYKNDPFGHRVLVKAVNYYDSLMPKTERGSTPDWYRAVHLLFMLGDGDSTIEIQVKTLPMAILQAWEHKAFYKNIDGEKPLFYESLLKLIWLANSVEAANYVYSKSRSLSAETLQQYLKSLDDKAQVSTTGGIDVRHVDAKLGVIADSDKPALMFTPVSIPEDSFDGLLPRIISIEQVTPAVFLNPS